MEFSPFIGKQFILKPVSLWLCFSKTTKVEFVERGPRSAGSVSTAARKEGVVLWNGMC